MPRKQDRALVLAMIGLLRSERGEVLEQGLAELDLEDLLPIWRELVNQRPAGQASTAYLEAEELFLTAYSQRHRLGLDSCLPTKDASLFLYEGDLCHLQVDAVVNAANSSLLGCFIPNHGCLDNALHTFAGVGLRQACAQLMADQGKPEAVGKVKVTSGFHLPASLVFHTVGPFVAPEKSVSAIRQHLLEQCYLACLEEARARNLKSIAFPTLATGEFGYPKEQAAQVAVTTVRRWLEKTEYPLAVIFSTFSVADQAYYHTLLGKKE